MKKLYFIGIDVSKEKLSCFDGKEEFSAKNDLDLKVHIIHRQRNY